MNLLKQAYYGQQDKKKTWEQVDQIIDVLNTGFVYLDFPIEKEINKYLVADGALEHIEEGDEHSMTGSDMSQAKSGKKVTIQSNKSE